MAQTVDLEAERQDLMRTLARCAELLPQLSDLMAAQPGLGPNTGTIGRHAPESKEPWASEAASAYWGIYFGSRQVADMLRGDLGIPDREWATGQDGLSDVANLVSACTPQSLREARRRCEGALNAALRIRDLDEVDRWTPVPQAPGVEPPVCPYCHTLSLRISRQRGEVRCFYPGCVDADRKPTRARMEYGAMTGDGILVFGDGTVVAYRQTDLP